MPALWYNLLVAMISTLRNLLSFSDAMNEYLAIAYYRMLCWI